MILNHLPSFILLSALLIDIVLGELPNKFHPVVFMGSYIKFLWKKRLSSSNKLLFLSGLLIIISGLVIFTTIPYFLIKILPLFISIVISVFLLKYVFSCRALIKAGKEVRNALCSSDLNKARELTSWHLVSRDVSELNEEQIVSAVIESLAENITDGFTSPLLFYSLGGIPAAWAYRFVNTSDSLIAYRKEDFEWGGKVTAWFDSILNWIPSRLTGFIICFASFLVKEDWKNSLKTMIKENKRTSSPNAGWTMASMAGALNITLEKKGDYILNGGNNQRVYQLIDRAIKIVVTTIILIVLISIVLLEVLN